MKTTAHDIEENLRNRFQPPSFAYLTQVRNGTGFSGTVRTADALVMGLWPSRGLYLQGFEIKVSRGDWMNELKNPAKAEEIAQYCDLWWVVAPKDIVNLEELPENWGLMVPNGMTTKTIKEAKQLKPKTLDRAFLAAILRRAQEELTPESKIKKAYDEGRIKGNDDKQSQVEFIDMQFKKLKEVVHNFEKKAGFNIDTWRGESIGEAVRMVLDGRHLHLKEDLYLLLDRSKSITESIEKELTKV